MKGIGKRVTVAILSIVASLTVSGIISLFELNNLSYDAETVLLASSRDMEASKGLLRSAHSHSRAMIGLVIFEDEGCRVQCEEASNAIDAKIQEVRKGASVAVVGSLDSVAMGSAELRRLAAAYSSVESVLVDSVAVESKRDGRKWFVEVYEPVYNQFVEQVERYTALSYGQFAPRVDQLSRNAHRPVIPVFISLLVMIAVVLMFYYFIYIYGVKPILRINRALSEHLTFKVPYKAKAEMIDEIKELNGNIENLVNISRSNKKQDGNAL
jgi:hypothetical protein